MKTDSHKLLILSILSIAVIIAFPGGTILAQAKYSLNMARIFPKYPQNNYSDKPSWGGGLAVVVPLTRTDIFPAVDIGMEYFNCLSENETITDPYYGSADIPTSQGIYRFYTGGRLGVNGPGTFRIFMGGHFALAVNRIHTAYVIYLSNGEGRQTPERENLYSQTRTSLGYDVNAGCELQLAETFIFESGLRYLHSFNAPIQLDDYRAIPIASDYSQIYFSVGAFFHTSHNQ